MKIALSKEESQAVEDLARMFDIKTNDVNATVVVDTSNGDVLVNIEPGFVVDYMGLIKTAAPLLKSVYGHAVSTFKAIESMGKMFDQKWSGKVTKEVA